LAPVVVGLIDLHLQDLQAHKVVVLRSGQLFLLLVGAVAGNHRPLQVLITAVQVVLAAVGHETAVLVGLALQDRGLMEATNLAI